MPLIIYLYYNLKEYTIFMSNNQNCDFTNCPLLCCNYYGICPDPTSTDPLQNKCWPTTDTNSQKSESQTSSSSNQQRQHKLGDSDGDGGSDDNDDDHHNDNSGNGSANKKNNNNGSQLSPESLKILIAVFSSIAGLLIFILLAYCCFKKTGKIKRVQGQTNNQVRSQNCTNAQLSDWNTPAEAPVCPIQVHQPPNNNRVRAQINADDRSTSVGSSAYQPPYLKPGNYFNKNN